MLNLIYCELLKLRHSKMIPISILGAVAVPFMLFVEVVQTHDGIGGNCFVFIQQGICRKYLEDNPSNSSFKNEGVDRQILYTVCMGFLFVTGIIMVIILHCVPDAWHLKEIPSLSVFCIFRYEVNIL